MDSKNRLAIAIAITCLIVVAMFASFGRSLFLVNIPSVSLAQLNEDTSEGGDSSAQGQDDQFWQVDVTPETVQSIVASLSRPESYYRELTVETLWSDGSHSTSVQFWQDGGWSHTRQILPSGAVRHDLTGEDTTYYWYEGSESYRSFPADEYSADLTQHIPTYEDVLDLDKDTITQTGYERRDVWPCVYLQVQVSDTVVERYWISTDTGLLVSAEREQNGQLVYRMTAYTQVQTPCPTPSPISRVRPKAMIISRSSPSLSRSKRIRNNSRSPLSSFSRPREEMRLFKLLETPSGRTGGGVLGRERL